MAKTIAQIADALLDDPPVAEAVSRAKINRTPVTYHVYSSLLGGYLSMGHQSREEAQKAINDYHNHQYDPVQSRVKEPLSIIPNVEKRHDPFKRESVAENDGHKSFVSNLTAAVSKASCEGCGKGLGAVEASRWGVCMPCTQARAKTVANRGKCTCPKTLKRPRTASNGLGRTWMACDRCLGSIKQLS
jgi:hypothetical protein